MIVSRKQALAVLGLNENANGDEWKSAYRAIAKKCHPDSGASTDGDYETYLLAREAYEFLLNNTVDNIELQTHTQYAVRTPKVMGQPLSETRKNSAGNNKKLQEKLKAEAATKKQERYEKICEEGRRLAQQEKEKKILDEIRWMRVADIIRRTIAEDKRREKLEADIRAAIQKKE